MRKPVSAQVPALTIAKYTIKGYVKERVLLVVLVFALLLMVSSYVLAPLAVGAQRKIIVDVGLASISVFGVLLVILIAAGSYSRERDKGILPNILSKPVGRVDFILGKFIGTWLTVLLVMACMTLVYFCVMLISRTSFNTVIFAAILLSALEVGVVTAVMTFFSTFTSPLLSALFTCCVVVSGHLSGDLLEFARHFGGAGFQVLSSIGYYVLPNLALFNVRSEAVHGLPLMESYVYSVALYGTFYTLFALFLSALIFRRKDVTA
jgi:ABC-type transport system involved in multi-copper enzyme maturation permease subunit